MDQKLVPANIVATVPIQQLPPHVLNTLIFQKQFSRPRTLPFEELFGAKPAPAKNPLETRELSGNQAESSSETPLRTLKELELSAGKASPKIPSMHRSLLVYMESTNPNSFSCKIILDVEFAKECLSTLKTLWNRGHFDHQLYKRIKAVMLSPEANPLQDKIVACLIKCSKDHWYRGGAEGLESAVNEQRFAFCMDIVNIIIADESSEPFRKEQQQQQSSSEPVVHQTVDDASSPVGESRDLYSAKWNLQRRLYPNVDAFVQDVRQLISSQLKRNPSTQLIALKKRFDGLIEYVE